MCLKGTQIEINGLISGKSGQFPLHSKLVGHSMAKLLGKLLQIVSTFYKLKSKQLNHLSGDGISKLTQN